jgi:ABC-type antimicrobial peptide transport system permease subunit
MLGIIIGVAAVIAMVGVGAGATKRIQEQIPEHRQQSDHLCCRQPQR